MEVRGVMGDCSVKGACEVMHTCVVMGVGFWSRFRGVMGNCLVKGAASGGALLSKWLLA